MRPEQTKYRKSRNSPFAKRTDNSTQAFQTPKDALMTASILATQRFVLLFILQTDASENAMGAVLSQNIDGNEHLIAFIRHKLFAREQNYPTTETECLAIIWVVESLKSKTDNLKYYLRGVKFTVETDNNPLKWLHEVCTKNQKLLKWSSGKGSENNADALSKI